MHKPSTKRAPNGTVPGLSTAISAEEFTLDRTGQRPLKFQGTRIGFGTTKHHDSTAWSEVTLYKTAGGRYIADVVYATQAQSEPDVSEALSCASADELIAALAGEDGKLDRAAFAACEDAVKTDTSFKEAWVETIP